MVESGSGIVGSEGMIEPGVWWLRVGSIVNSDSREATCIVESEPHQRI
jgi:hypothetical protein